MMRHPWFLRTCRTLIYASCLVLIWVVGAQFNHRLRVQHWHVHGVDAQLVHQIDRALGNMPSLDFLDARPARLREQLLAEIPDLKQVNIARHLPDTLEIQAVKRRPVALWFDAHQQLWLIDKAGHSYRRQTRKEHFDLPILRVARSGLVEAGVLLDVLRRMDTPRYVHLSECIALPDAWQMNFEQGQRWLLPRDQRGLRHMRKLIALIHDQRWPEGGRWRVDARMNTRWFIRKTSRGVI